MLAAIEMIEFYRPSLRASVAIVVLLTWLGSLGWLAARRLGRSEAATLSTEATLRLAPGTTWFALESGRTQVGTAAITLDTLSPGYRVIESEAIMTPSRDRLVRTDRRTETWLGASLDLARMSSQYRRNGHRIDWTVERFDDSVVVHRTSGSTRVRGIGVYQEVPTPAAAVPYRLALGGGLATDRSREVTLLDGWPMNVRRARLDVGRDSFIVYADSSAPGAAGDLVAAHTDSAHVWAVVVDGPSGRRRLWVDHRGTISGIETALGLRWIRSDFDLSDTHFRRTLATQRATIRAAMAVLRPYVEQSPSTRDTFTGARRFLIAHRDGSPTDPALLGMLKGGRQTIEGDTLVVGGASSLRGSRWLPDSAPDPMIQSNARAIVVAARGLMEQPLTAVTLPTFVARFHSLVRLDTTVDAADDALSTYARRAGSVDGMARLFVALVRARGQRARYVIGVAPRGDTLWTHAWAEVRGLGCGGEWCAIDPVDGRAQASTGLLRIACAGSSRPEEMVPLVANARVMELDQRARR